MSVAELLAKHKITLDNDAPGQHSAICPRCSHERKKKNVKCLGVLIDADGKSACWNCGHCGWKGPEKGSGGTRRESDITYDYTDTDGALLFQKVRNPPGSTARFYCRRPDGNGRWINSLKGIEHKPLYRWPEIREAMREGREIALVEGEKDANNLWKLGIPATCNFDGAADVIKNQKSKPKWKAEYSEALCGADLVVFNDNDMPGYAHAYHICSMSHGVAQRVRRLDLAPHWPEIPKGGDVSDWLAAGHTKDELAALIAAAPDYETSDQAEATQEQASDTGGAAGTDAEIERLAKLTALEYERQRKAAAEKLKVRAPILDKLVEGERLRLNPDANKQGQGQPIEFPQPEPWPEPVKGTELLDAIATAIRMHVVLPDRDRADDFKPCSPNDGCTVAKREKPNNDGLLHGCTVGEGGLGGKSASSAPDGVGLSSSRERELAHWYLDRATTEFDETGDVSSAELDAGLRQVLAEEVSPEFVEAAFERIMQLVFAGAPSNAQEGGDARDPEGQYDLTPEQREEIAKGIAEHLKSERRR